MVFVRFLMAFFAATAVTNAPGWAQTYPAKPIRFVYALPPGGTTDILARLLGAKMHEAWGQPVVVENRAGAGGNIGADFVAKSPPDGYTILMGASGPLATNVSLFSASCRTIPRKDFAPVALVGVGAAGAGGPPVAAGEEHQGVHRADEGAAGPIQLRIGRARVAAAPDGGNVQIHGQGRDDPRPVQGQRCRRSSI